MRRFIPTALTLTLALLAASCSDAESSAPACAFEAPVTGDKVLHVSSACGTPEGDGSLAAPFANLPAAAAAAQPGDTIALSAGSYAGAELPAGVSLVGAGATATSIASPPGVGLTVSGGADDGITIVSGLTIDSAVGAGLFAEGVSVHLSAVHVLGTSTSPDGSGGHGVHVRDAPELRLEACVISGNGGVGIVATRVETVEIIDPTYTVAPRSGDAGIIDPTYKPQSVVADNAGSGIGIIDPTYSVTLEGVDIQGNAGHGVSIFGPSNTTVTGCAIRGTKLIPGDPSSGQGLVLAPSAVAAPAEVPSVVVEADNLITGNARAGVAILAAKVEVDLHAEVSFNGRAGAAVQGELAGLNVLAEALVSDNDLAGILALDGTTLVVSGAEISRAALDTWADIGGGDPIETGDGAMIRGESTAVVTDALFDANARVGLIAEGADSLSISATTFSGGQYGIALNSGGADNVDVDPNCQDQSVACTAPEPLPLP